MPVRWRRRSDRGRRSVRLRRTGTRWPPSYWRTKELRRSVGPHRPAVRCAIEGSPAGLAGLTRSSTRSHRRRAARLPKRWPPVPCGPAWIRRSRRAGGLIPGDRRAGTRRACASAGALAHRCALDITSSQVGPGPDTGLDPTWTERTVAHRKRTARLVAPRSGRSSADAAELYRGRLDRVLVEQHLEGRVAQGYEAVFAGYSGESSGEALVDEG